jgi:magnesium chelatase subunit D
VRAGVPRGGNRLSLIETLRAAAPWQKLRREPGDTRVRIRRDDLRIKRFQSRAETTTIFVVDASGSSAAARLAEAKGAVELLLAEAYVKRAQVALIAFRGTGAELILPPTRSLTRARRALAELPGGGGTPLAAGLAMAGEVAALVRSKDRTPFVVVLTDGRGNIALDGMADAGAAKRDVEGAARAMNAPGVLIDISARPREEGRAIAALMGAKFVALPRGDALSVRDAVKAS